MTYQMRDTRCLVVGGTGFLGGAIVDALTARGHPTTILSRGHTQRATAEPVHVLHMDRWQDLSALGAQRFDWVFDTCAFAPEAVRSLLEALGNSVTRYVLVSSISAYQDFSQPSLSEDQPVPATTEADLRLADSVPVEQRSSAAAYGQAYGPLKRACEMQAEDFLRKRATILRAGLLVGAGDYTDRLTWWVRRIDRAKKAQRPIPVPLPEDRAVQLIDARDAADFALRCAADNLPGIWNITGKPQPLPDLLAKIRKACDSPAEFACVSEAAIARAGVVPWSELPLMAPSNPAFRHFLNVSTDKAMSAGLSIRPIIQTIEPLLHWDRSRRAIPLKCGMSAEQEASLLA